MVIRTTGSRMWPHRPRGLGDDRAGDRRFGMLAGHLATRHDTKLWARDSALIESLSRTHENTRYLEGGALGIAGPPDPFLTGGPPTTALNLAAGSGIGWAGVPPLPSAGAIVRLTL